MALKICVVQSNPHIADVCANAKKIVEIIKNLRKKADLVVSSELYLCGYPPKDLLLSRDFLAVCREELLKIDSVYKQFFQQGKSLPASLVGAPELVIKNNRAMLYNAVFFFDAQGLRKTIHKVCLPNYDIFEEKRYFTEGDVEAVLNGQNCIEIPFFADVLDNSRDNVRDAEKNIVRKASIFVSVCEDMWGPWLKNSKNKSFGQELTANFPNIAAMLSQKKKEKTLSFAIPQILINLSSSPFALQKKEKRYEAACQFLRCFDDYSFLLWVNQVGANDGLVFDGGSFLAGGDVRRFDVEHVLPFFEEECGCFSFRYDENINEDSNDFFLSTPKKVVWEGYSQCKSVIENDFLAKNLKKTGDDASLQQWKKNVAGQNVLGRKKGLEMLELEHLIHALVLGIRDYVRKGGFSSVLIGLSGGVDSALTTALAVLALGAKNVFTLGMPSPYSSLGSVEDSREFAKRLGFSYEVFSIGELLKSFHQQWEAQHLAEIPLEDGTKSEKLRGVAAENVQARLRGLLLMSQSNVRGHLLLSTGNKSEISVGYCTLYGDTNGALGVLGDCFKTQVYQMSRYINDILGNVIPENIIAKEPSAELSLGQKDSDSLPPYDVLDGILELAVVKKCSAEEIKKRGFAKKTVDFVLKLVRQSEYKRHQLPPVIRVRQESFGMGRKMPITF